MRERERKRKRKEEVYITKKLIAKSRERENVYESVPK